MARPEQVKSMVIAAKYENGVFKPVGEVNLKEGTLVEVYVSPETGTNKKPSIRRLGFAGMWAGRAEIKDGVSYVDDLRENPRG
jgi:predicted DNA-binding antitoxin AbrB/MazE fold protein